MHLQIKSKVVSAHGKMDVLDENENVVYRVHNKFLTIHDKTYIEDAQGNEVAYIHAKAISIHHVYYVEMANGETFELKEELMHIKDFIDVEPLGWQLRGKNILEFNFSIYDNNDQVIATAHRKFLSLHSIYDMEVLDESKAQEVLAIFIIMKHIIEHRMESTDNESLIPNNSNNTN